MIARVTIAQGRAAEIETTVHFFEDVGIPAGLGVRGFNAAYLLVDRGEGKWVEPSLWENKAADEAAMAAGANGWKAGTRHR